MSDLAITADEVGTGQGVALCADEIEQRDQNREAIHGGGTGRGVEWGGADKARSVVEVQVE